MQTKETVEISRDRYLELIGAERWLEALEAAGVDNWDGISYAHDLLEESNDE